MPTVSKGFICYQERANEHDRHAVAVYRDREDILGHLPREFSHVAFFLEHNGSITGRVTDRRRYCRERGGMEIPCQLTFSGKRKHILKRFFGAHQLSCIERLH